MKKILSLTITLLIMLQMVFCCNLVFATDGAPKVVSITPSGEGVAEASAIVVKFDKAMYSGRLTPSYIVLRNKSDNNAVVPCNEYWAYDTQYVAVYELSPDTTYELEVSASVESAAATVEERVQMGEQYLHTFSTGETLNKVTDITPKSDASYVHNYTTGHDGNCILSYLYDRDDSTWLRVNGGTADQKSYSFITVELGENEKLAYFKLTTASDSDNLAKYIHIQVSNDVNFADENTVELAVTPSSAGKGSTWGAAPSDGVAYKYIRIYRDSNISASDDAHCRISEIYVYGYETAEESDVIETVTSPVQISKTDEYTVNSYELRGSLALGGEVTFDTDITLNGDYTLPKVYAAVYSEVSGAKKLVAFNESEENTSVVSVTVPADAVNATVKFFILTDELNPLIECVQKGIN